MATKLSGAVAREVQTLDGRELIIVLTPAGVTVREKGRRTTYGPVSYGLIFQRAAQAEADALVREARAQKPLRVKRGLLGSR